MLAVHHGLVVLTDEQVAELRAVISSRDVPAVVATRARIVLWTAEGRMRKDVAVLARVSLPTVDRWVDRYERLQFSGSGRRACVTTSVDAVRVAGCPGSGAIPRI